jgi:hypothetical protein
MNCGRLAIGRFVAEKGKGLIYTRDAMHVNREGACGEGFPQQVDLGGIIFH